MRTFILIQISLWISISRAQTQQHPSIRVRLNKGIFEQASSIVAGLVEYETPRVQIPNTQQCFQEGCVQIHSFHVTSFRQPSLVLFQPHPPNQFLLRVQDLDFYVSGTLGGTITVIINLPVAGTVYVTGRGISISAYLDLQKNIDDKPYLRFLSCQIDGGLIETRVANMGLFTDTVNTKYRGQMTAQTRQLLQEAICANIHRLTQQHFSNRMAKLPTSLSAKTLMEMMLNSQQGASVTPMANVLRSKRDADYEETMNGIPEAEEEMTTKSRLLETTTTEIEDIPSIILNGSEISRFFNYNRLKHLFVDVNLLDASATYEEYSIGMSGEVFSTKQAGSSPYHPPYPYRLPRSTKQRMIEMGISQYTINTMMYQAHRTNSLLFHVDSNTPKFGKLLRTTCSIDEVCISDQVEEVGQKYPDKNLELIIRTTSAPVMDIREGSMTMTMEGRCLFFIQGTREKIGVLPFKTSMNAKITSHGSTIRGHISISHLTFTEGIDFFGLSSEDLEGFGRSIKGTMEHMVNGVLEKGINLNTKDMKLPLRISSPTMSLEPGILLIQANLDLYNTLYAENNLFTI